MHTNAIVANGSRIGLFIVKHRTGYTVVQLADHDQQVGVGDLVRADWDWSGRAEIRFASAYHECHFHSRCRRLSAAKALYQKLLHSAQIA